MGPGTVHRGVPLLGLVDMDQIKMMVMAENHQSLSKIQLSLYKHALYVTKKIIQLLDVLILKTIVRRI